MKPYPIEFRQKIITVYEKESISIRNLAQRFCVAKSFIQKLLKQYIAFLDRVRYIKTHTQQAFQAISLYLSRLITAIKRLKLKFSFPLIE